MSEVVVIPKNGEGDNGTAVRTFVPKYPDASPEDEIRKRSITKMLSDFSRRTSAHGIPFLSMKTTFRRLIWFGIVSLAFIIFLLQVYWILSKYFLYGTKSEYEVRYEPAPFPAVTVCNLNAYDDAAFRRFMAMNKEDMAQSQYSHEISARENLLFLAHQLKTEDRKKISYGLNDLVTMCSFEDKDCVLERDFTIKMDANYGNCYTYNFNQSVALINSKEGPKHGLRLLLDIHRNGYMSTAEAAGVRVVIHDKQHEPFPESSGYYVSPGTLTSIGLRTKIHKRLSEPYGQCSDDFKPNRFVYGDRYSQQACYQSCFQIRVITQCLCGDPRFPLDRPNDRYCNVDNKEERACLYELRKQESPNNCTCPMLCSENTYTVTLSTAEFPPRQRGFERSSQLLLEVYYEQLQYGVIREEPSYTFCNALYDIMIAMAIWIGFSFITLFEVAEVIWQIINERLIKPKITQRDKQPKENILFRRRSEFEKMYSK